MEFSTSCMSCAALVEAAILTTIRVVAECAEDPDYIIKLQAVFGLGEFTP